MKKKKDKLEEELSRLSADDPARLRKGLAHPISHVAARAARLIQQHGLAGFHADLEAAFRRFIGEKDASCAAKVAALEALDYGEHQNEEVFVIAARLVQMEKAAGGPVDTAGPVRARGIVGLARLGWEDLDLLAAELLHDKDAPVRQAALDALAHSGRRSGASLALYKLRLGDDDPMVTLAAMCALLSLAPEWGLRELAARLSGADAELAAIALGQSKSDPALRLLIEALQRCVQPSERKPLYRGIGLHRSEAALQLLLKVVDEAPPPEAQDALAALAPRQYDPGVAEKLRQAAERRGLTV